ncbi:MAG TPA: hypothetical protein VMQ99_15185 [Acetobacteraceae bacterium]|nr:hypothetical protein [Acetobacteraceae bacterium]
MAAEAVGPTVPAMGASGMPTTTSKLLLSELDPGVRIIGQTEVKDVEGDAQNVWLIAPSPPRVPELHPNRIVVNVEAPAGSKAFSLVVAGLSKIGFTVTGVASVPLPDNPFGYRYMLILMADKPLLALRVTDAIARDSGAGAGRAVLIGAWKQVP